MLIYYSCDIGLHNERFLISIPLNLKFDFGLRVCDIGSL